MTRAIHVAIAFDDLDIEATCPCPKNACGFVTVSRANPNCGSHGRFKTAPMRRHLAIECPAKTTTPTT